MTVQVVQHEFTEKQQGYNLTVIARIDAKTTLRARVYRDAYDAQGKFVCEVWGKGITPQGWAEVVRYQPETCASLASPYTERIDKQADAELVAASLVRDALRTLGYGEDRAIELSEEAAYTDVVASS